MKQNLLLLLLVLSPFSLFSQTVADTSLLLEKTDDEFHEFYWQHALEIIQDSTFYYFKPKAEVRRLEIISPTNKIIWHSKDIDPTFSLPHTLFKEQYYQIRMYGPKGITQIVWFP